MQLMWISGPTGEIRKVCITSRKILAIVCVLSLALMVFSLILYLIGFKIAIEVQPELIRSLGGISTKADQEKMEAVYRERLAKLRGELGLTLKEIGQLQTLKNRFMEIATPVSMRKDNTINGEGRGGPFFSPAIGKPVSLNEPVRETYSEPLGETYSEPLGETSGEPLGKTYDHAAQEFTEIEVLVQSLQRDWRQQLSWLYTLPTGIPIHDNATISSRFGKRIDPINGRPANHKGIDFSGEIGTPIVASADGVVTRTGWGSDYGNIVEITHAEGFVTRYAHISRTNVLIGQKVKRGDHIADVGNTGRSTGPHLHYEVFRYGHAINPKQAMIASNN
jgi:murein DD-endopeptidase MepM/ murein hydrolase activator NlpD